MLTCKRIHKQAADFSHLARRVDEKDALSDLLLRLERDLPERNELLHRKVYCMEQQKLVGFWRAPASITRKPGLYRHSCFAAQGTWNSPAKKSIVPAAIILPYSEGPYYVTWCYARLMTNSHFFGLRRGFAPSEIGPSVLERSSAGVKVVESWEARVVPVTGELLFSCVRQYTCEGNAAASTLADFITKPTAAPLTVWRSAICKHHIDAVSGSFSEGDTPTQLEGGCRECHTDWTAEYTRQRPACAGSCKRCDLSVYVVTFSTFHNPGDCRLPANAKWSAHLGQSAPGFHQIGSTKALWETCEARGE